jgi:hypothetical protein
MTLGNVIPSSSRMAMTESGPKSSNTATTSSSNLPCSALTGEDGTSGMKGTDLDTIVVGIDIGLTYSGIILFFFFFF